MKIHWDLIAAVLFAVLWYSLVVIGKASVEGFVGIDVYIIKKLLDIHNDEKDAANAKP